MTASYALRECEWWICNEYIRWPMIAQSSSLGGRPEVWVLAHMLRRVIVVVSESVSLCFATPQQFTSRPQTIEKPKAEGGGGGGGGGGVHLESYTREARRRSLLPSGTGEASTTRSRVASAQTNPRRREGVINSP